MMAWQSPTHRSQMKTPRGPVTSFFTTCWDLPQNEQCRVFGSLWPIARSALRRARASEAERLGFGMGSVMTASRVREDLTVRYFLTRVKAILTPSAPTRSGASVAVLSEDKAHE